MRTALLADHPEAVATLAHWFRDQWPDHYAGRPLDDIEAELRSEANRDGLPVRLVAFADGALAGTVTLREHAIATSPGYAPGLGGLLVHARHRGRGIGSALVLAGVEVAQRLGFTKVFTATATAVGLLARLGWNVVEDVSHGEERLRVYERAVSGDPAPTRSAGRPRP